MFRVSLPKWVGRRIPMGLRRTQRTTERRSGRKMNPQAPEELRLPLWLSEREAEALVALCGSSPVAA